MARGKGSRLGYIFSPKNIEVMKYLVGFTRDEPLPNQNQYMEVVILYAENEPWQIFEGTNSYTRYFITPQKKQNSKWKRVSRTVEKGTWKPQGKGKEVFDNKGRLMGYVKSLKYTYGKSDNKNANGEWLMTEYYLNDGYLEAREIKNKGYVICKIKKKRKPNDDNENGVSDENMNDIEKLIDSSLQLDDDINVEEDDVGNEVLAILDKEDDGDPNVECLEGHP